MTVSFKQKKATDASSKKKDAAVPQSLQAAHQKRVSEFQEAAKKAEGYLEQMERCRAELEELRRSTLKEGDSLRRVVELEDRLVELEDLHAAAVDRSEEVNYYFAASEVISEYNDLDVSPVQCKVSIDDFLNRKKPDSTKKKLLQSYLELVDPRSVPHKSAEPGVCEDCKEELVPSKEPGTLLCTFCGRTSYDLLDTEVNTKSNNKYSDYVRYSSVYQRKNHFKEWLNQIQGKESTEVPQHVFDAILVELHKNRFKNLANLTPTLVQRVLKKLGFSKYYENTFNIIYRLSGIEPPSLTRDTEEMLMKYFRQIEEPFKLYKKRGRKNILRYSYILYKLCELVELDEMLPCFKLLKNRSKLIEQDAIWQCICRHLGWEFIPSI